MSHAGNKALDEYFDAVCERIAHLNSRFMESLERLARELDDIDRGYGDTARDRSQALWAERGQRKDEVSDKIDQILPTIAFDQFSLPSYLLSSSFGRQTVAIKWIRFERDSTHLNLLCYMLLNSTSNFLQFHLLTVFETIQNQCDYDQLVQMGSTLDAYHPPEKTSRMNLRSSISTSTRSLIQFSVSDIIPHSYWWKDVESKFFNSLSGDLQYRVAKLQIIRNHQLHQQFQKYRAQLGDKNQILFVFHGSSSEALQHIAKTGFLEPGTAGTHSQRPTKLDEGYFGRGIYHGLAADYAIHYSTKYRKSDQILLSAVLPGRSYVVRKGGEKLGKTCEAGFHSHISPEQKEIVLFRSEQILPLFIITFALVPTSEVEEEQC